MKITQIFSRMRAARDRRTALLHLCELDNHLLFDIGVTRQEVLAALERAGGRK